MKSYRELDLTHFTSRYNFLSKITRSDIDKTLCQFEPAFQGTQAGDGEATAMALYRELDNAVLLLDTFCLFFQNKQNTRSDIEATLCQFE